MMIPFPQLVIPIPSPLVEFIVLGPLEDRRQLQDSPILGDVWVEYGQKPNARLDLLIVPYRAEHPGFVANKIEKALLRANQEDLEATTEADEELTGEVESTATTPTIAADPLPTWELIKATKITPDSDQGPKVAYLQGLVVARLTFFEVLRIVAPKTRWWISRWTEPETESKKSSVESADESETSTDEIKLEHEAEKFDFHAAKELILTMLDQVRLWQDKSPPMEIDPFPSFQRFLVLMGLILWAGEQERPKDFTSRIDRQIEHILESARKDIDRIAQLLVDLLHKMLADKTRNDPLVWQVSLNRSAFPALSKSVPAVKADAAKTLFRVDCSTIGWAVVDSGIEGSHPAFIKDGKSRVKRSFDFKNFRSVVSLGNDRDDVRRDNLMLLLQQPGLLLTQPLREAPQRRKDAVGAIAVATALRLYAEMLEAEARAADQEADITKNAALNQAVARTKAAAAAEAAAVKKAADLSEALPKQEKQIIENADEDLKKLALDARNKRPIHWELVEKFVRIEPGTKTQTNHGTHVAGIIGASTDTIIEESKRNGKKPPSNIANGMCPDIMLYDFRVLGRDLKETEFAIIAALQFIRHLNDRDNLFTIHGANLSLSIPHDVRNFACGRTPICDESERLVASGVVVVAAAGNHGYKSFQTAEGSYDSYAAFSITDPGNAENVLTVGATHRFWPHTYGVSFFSSRGPTGDGRLKPDLVAPGERIFSTFPDGKWGDLDGTSMAAPHVSGAAAMLMARYSELIGQPLRVKRILCDSATDLGRERSFQGRGMLDVLRSFQSI